MAAGVEAASAQPNPGTPDGTYSAGPMECIRASGVQLTLTSGPNNTLEAMFSFAMKTGHSRRYSYRLRGFYDPSKRLVRLIPEKWEVPYSGYSLAPIEARFDPRGGNGAGELKGSIDYSGCRRLTLRRDPATMTAPLRTTAVASAMPASGPPHFLAALDRRLPSIGSAKGDERCALLVRWLARFNAEESIGPLDHGARPLFRDEEFVALFGQPYEVATPKWRQDLYEDVISKCLSNRRVSPIDIGKPLRTYAEQVGMFQEFLHAALVRPSAGVSPGNISQTLKQGRDSREWMTSTLRTANGAPPTLESLSELRHLLQAIDRDAHYLFFTQHRGLWPSEQEAFAKALRSKVSSLSGDAVTAWLAELRRGGSTLAAVQRANREIQTYADYLAMIERPQREPIVANVFAVFNEIVDAAMASQLDILRRAAPSLEGLIRSASAAATLERLSNQLYLDKKIDYRDAAEAKMIRAGLIDVHSALRERIASALKVERSRVIEGAAAEWRAYLAGVRTWDDLQAPARMLRQMFVDGDRERASRTAFEAVLLKQAGVELPGFNHPDLFASLFLGRFRLLSTNTMLDASSARRYALEAYVIKFSQQCSQFLPSDRVQIVRVETESLIEKRGGLEVSRTELRREMTKTGIFAAPEFGAAYTRPLATDVLSGIGQLLVAMTKDPTLGFQTVGRMVETALEVRADTGKFLDRHGCASPVTKRFAENVLRASTDRLPVEPVLD